jgi:histidinol-phosphate phosphatase family protein
MIIPNQAVILCGGRGIRLRPITDHLPKPMVRIHSRPFLEYLILQLKQQGISEILLLTGFFGEKIREYFGDGTKFSIIIKYSHGPEEWDTSKRLWEARNQIHPWFLLLYSDNFVPFNIDNLLSLRSRLLKPISLLLQPKTPGNISLNADGLVEKYDPSRKGKKLNYVEVGYMLIDKDIVFSKMGTSNTSFSIVINQFVSELKVAGFVGYDQYHSIGDLERLKITTKYLKLKKIVLLDRDGLINKKMPTGEYVTSWDEFEWIPETLEALELISKDGFEFIIISNQAGIARGMVSKETVLSINTRMQEELIKFGVKVIQVYICPHHWEVECFCRKPNPGMFFQAARDHLFRLDQTLYVGDDTRDCQAAFNAGCDSIFIGKEQELSNLSEHERPVYLSGKLSSAVNFIKQYYAELG